MKRNIKSVKHIVLLSCLIIILVQVMPNVCAQEKDEPDSLYARAAVLMDAESGRVLFGKSKDMILSMASTTKIMTCILALENMKNDQIVKVSDSAIMQPKVKLGMQSGETFYLKDLLYSLMLESHNDSAVVIAEGIAGSVTGFADKMNQKAEEIGCTSTYFITPNGLDATDEIGTHATTAEDLAKIMRYCIMESPKKDEFLSLTQTRTYHFTDCDGTRNFQCVNHNAFLDMMDGVITGKTGFTGEAGYCYVCALKNGHRTFIVSLLACGWPGNKTYKWKDAKKLLEYGLEHYNYRNVWENIDDLSIPVKEAVSEKWSKMLDGDCDHNEDDSRRVKVAVENPRGELMALLKDDEKVRLNINLPKEVIAPINKGKLLGSVQYLLEDQVIGEYPIVSMEVIERNTIAWNFRRILEMYLI